MRETGGEIKTGRERAGERDREREREREKERETRGRDEDRRNVLSRSL